MTNADRIRTLYRSAWRNGYQTAISNLRAAATELAVNPIGHDWLMEAADLLEKILGKMKT